MNRHALFTLRAASILVLGGLAASVLPAKSDFESNDDYLYQHFESNGAQVRYVEKGAGEPLVLIPARGGTVADWIKAGAFELPYHTVALDYEGNDFLNDEKEIGEDVIHLLDRLRTPRAHIAAYSGHAGVVAYLSQMHPDRILTATVAEVPRGGLPQPGAIEILPAAPEGSTPDPLFMRSLTLFLHAHPARHKLWEPTESAR